MRKDPGTGFFLPHRAQIKLARKKMSPIKPGMEQQSQMERHKIAEWMEAVGMT